MLQFYNYLKYDFKQLIKRKLNKYYLLTLLLILIIDIFFTYNNQLKFFNNISETSSSWYVFLENRESVFRNFYFTFMPILSIIPFGLQYYDEKHSKYKIYLISKGSRRSYYLSKFIVTFISGFGIIFSFLIINFIIVKIIYPNNFILNGAFLQPTSGSFIEKIFYNNINLYEFIYIIINAFVGGLLSVLSLSLSMIFNYKNGFLVIAVPFIICTIQSIVLFFFSPYYDINNIIQPATRFGLKNPLTYTHVITSLLSWLIIIVILFIIGYKKERDIL